ncbi:MAG: hypothetical protein C0505_01305 [Leptothrix sp. (in: Bacteria)]|nr:hypothetical protein [Leptothrix sp. (in: b-proteobacteria)]
MRADAVKRADPSSPEARTPLQSTPRNRGVFHVSRPPRLAPPATPEAGTHDHTSRHGTGFAGPLADGPLGGSTSVPFDLSCRASPTCVSRSQGVRRLLPGKGKPCRRALLPARRHATAHLQGWLPGGVRPWCPRQSHTPPHRLAAPRRYGSQRLHRLVTSGAEPSQPTRAGCRPTPRSNAAPTAGHPAWSGGTRYSFASQSPTSCRWRPLGSKVGVTGEPRLIFQALADAVLLLHFGVVLFVILGLPVVLVGNRFAWPWVNHLWWRLAHLAAIVAVALQAWLGQYCPLTLLESSLREQTGQVGYQRSFIEHWLHRALYYEAPPWLFTLVYTGFGLLVAWAWWRFPPRRNRRDSA